MKRTPPLSLSQVSVASAAARNRLLAAAASAAKAYRAHHPGADGGADGGADEADDAAGSPAKRARPGVPAGPNGDCIIG